MMSTSDPITFETVVLAEEGFIFISIPFAPREVWGAQPRYHVLGMINGNPVRGTLGALGPDYFLRLAKPWLSEHGIKPGDKVTVELSLELRNKK